jgi:fibronectin-binding autotransporter adhesin
MKAKQTRFLPHPPARSTRTHGGLVLTGLFASLALASQANAQTTASAGAAAAPTVGTVPSGSTAGTFLDLAIGASWTAGVPDIATEAIFSGGIVGTTTDLSANKLTLGDGTNIYGATYQTSTTDSRTITVGGGGLSTGTVTDALIGHNIVLDVGATDQSWTIGSGKLLNYRGLIAGSSVVTLDGAGTLWKRDALSSGFTGNWNVTSGSMRVESQWGIGNTSASVSLSNNAMLRMSSSGTYSRNLSVGSGGGILYASTDGVTFSGALSGTGALTIDKASNATLTIDSDMTAHEGALAILRGGSNTTVDFTSSSTASFALGNVGVVDGVDTAAGASASLVRAGTGANAVTVNFDGTFTIDLSGAQLANGAVWNLVDTTNLSTAFTTNFAITGFEDDDLDDLWTKVDGNQTWTFSEATGQLSLAVSGLPLITTITTTGAGLDLDDGITWDDYLGNDIVPNNTATEEFVPVFDEPGVYTAPTSSVFNWSGMAIEIAGVEINPDGGGNAYAINLGTAGISGTQGVGRLGANLTLNVGANDQTWAVSAGNVKAVLTGTSNVTLAGGDYWYRGNNSGFTGTWSLTNGSSIRTSDNNSIGGAGVAVNLGTATTLRLAGGNSHGASLNLSGSSGIVRIGTNLTTSLNGAVSGGTLVAPATLTLNPDNGTANSLNLNGTLADHIGPLALDLTNLTEDFTATLGNGAEDEFSFVLGADKIVDGVDTTSVPLISAGAGAGVTNLVLNNTLTIDTSAAAIADGNSWNLIDTISLLVSTDASFSVSGFTLQGDGVTWIKTEGANTWTLDMDTGVLTLASSASGFASWITGTFANGTVTLRGPNDDGQ